MAGIFYLIEYKYLQEIKANGEKNQKIFSHYSCSLYMSLFAGSKSNQKEPCDTKNSLDPLALWLSTRFAFSLIRLSSSISFHRCLHEEHCHFMK